MHTFEQLRRAVSLVMVLAASAGAQNRVPPTVVVIPAAAADSANVLLTIGVASLLEAELSNSEGAKVIAARAGAWEPVSSDTVALRAARAAGAAYAIVVRAEQTGTSVRASARVVAGPGSTRVVDPMTSSADVVPTLVVELASAIRDFVLPDDVTRGGPVFRPPRPTVPMAALTLYSRALRARAAGDPDTAKRLLRESSQAAPEWDVPRRLLASIK